MNKFKLMCVIPFMVVTTSCRSLFPSRPDIKGDAFRYYSSKQISLKNAEDHNSDVDILFDYLTAFSNKDIEGQKAGQSKFGTKFLLALVQEDCSDCDARYGAFKTLEENWGKGSFEKLKDEVFKFYTIFVDTKNKSDDNLFEKVYERQSVAAIFEEVIPYMAGEMGVKHPYKDNCPSPDSYVNNLTNLTSWVDLSTPTTFLIDMTDNTPKWTSPHGIREVLFSFDGTNGSDDYAKARTLRNAWTNFDSKENIFSPSYIQ